MQGCKMNTRPILLYLFLFSFGRPLHSSRGNWMCVASETESCSRHFRLEEDGALLLHGETNSDHHVVQDGGYVSEFHC